jgi:hypothetical protein
VNACKIIGLVLLKKLKIACRFWPLGFESVQLLLFLGKTEIHTYANKPHLLQELEDNITQESVSISTYMLHCVLRNILSW